MIDILSLIKEKGGNPDLVKESQKARGASVELVDKVIEAYGDWVKLNFVASQTSKEMNEIQKQITVKMKAKVDASELLAQKAALTQRQVTEKEVAKEKETEMWKMCGTIGNIIHPECVVSLTEDDNGLIKTWHPDGPDAQPSSPASVMPHHEIMHRLGFFDLERGSKISGHRAYFLKNNGVRLNQALLNYGLDYLGGRGYDLIQTPFFMRKDAMSKTAQLEQFDEELYKVVGGEEDNYLIATSEQPISAMHMNEWFDSPASQLPIQYAGYSTCFRKEAGSAGRDVWGIFRVHQFEKVEQFCITEPAKSQEMFHTMAANSMGFYESLKLPYRVVSIVSGALNNAAAIKYDVEAWFPFQGEYKELQSISNCTDYQSRSLEVRCGVKKQGDTTKTYVHMLNGTLTATERALCCIVENYQTPDGIRIPEVLQPYMGGKDFLPWVQELPKTLEKKVKK